MHLKWETNQMNFKCISREKEKRKKSYENFTVLMIKKDQEFVECEINNFQIIRLSHIGESQQVEFSWKRERR